MDVIRLESQEFTVSGEICIDFWYHMLGSETQNELKVVIKNNLTEGEVWQVKGNQGSSWLYGSRTVHFSTNSNIMVIFEAIRGQTHNGDTAIDNIAVRRGSCSKVLSESSCIVQGDPHYKSFDKQAHNFMGTCTYTLSKLCSTNSSLPYFNVEAANEHRSGNAYVSYVRHVTVEVFNHRIVLGKGRIVKVDGEVAVLPMSVTSEVLVALSGQYVVITTSFGLRVKFNGRHRAEVTLPSPFKGKVCGLCGNYNDDRRDDFLNPDGIMEPDSVSFGNSWQTPNDTRCTPDVGVRPNCTSEEKRIIESNQYCGIIVDLHGPFKGCHSKIDPEVYFDDCVYDLCALGTETGSLCSSLESYGDACQSAGAKVEGWRNETFCPLKCGANSHYEQCGSACPATCASPSAPSSCLQPCVEGCVCDSGYLFYNDRCVPKHQCGCWSEGKHYPVGSEFWTDDTCSTQCRCPSAGSQMVCSNSTCSRDSYCGVVNGVPGCYPYTYGICRVHNDPHYNTFDKATLHFMGSCTYTIAKLCGNSSSLPHFNIEAKNENRGNPKVSYVQRVQVAVRDHKVWIVKMEPHRVLVDEVWATLPVQLAEGAVSVRRSGRYVVLSTDFGLHVSYDTDHSVEVKVPSTYFNQTCGMCGNYNGMRGDDYMKPDGEQAKDSNELGNSWKVPPFEPGCDPDEGEEECQPADEARYRSDEFCGLITSQQGPFVNCHSVISAHGIFESCVVELCLLDGDRVALCNSLQIYADACQSAGVTVLPWRNATFCDVMCPANSHYNACASACPTTCTDRSASANCSEPCVEDCECNAGFVLSGSSCVPVENCGCTHNNQYYEKGAMFWEDGCREKCRCTGNDRVECEPGSCGAGEICKVQGGIWGCYRPDTAICHIYGDPHYTTFDGKLYHFQGACNYTVTETCGNSSVRFSLTSRNEHRGNPTWSAINSVGLRLDNLHIALRKNKRVYVDGERVELPVRPIPSVKVTLLGSFVLLETDFGLQVKFDGDQQLVVVVDERYQGQLCGLCGTYTNDQLDDFLKPDGILALDSNQFGNSWAVADDDWQCNQTAPVPPTCDPPSQEEAERYCKIVLDNPGPFEECHWHIPPQLYFESCVYDHCVTGGDSVQLCNTLASYASACEAAGVVLGDWRQQSGCFEKSCALDCNFDSDLCRWTQSKTDTLDWKRISGSTPSFNTGPAFDHTTAGGYYVYLEGNDGKPGDRAQLISAPCVKSGAQCMRFWYHMYGVAQSMALNVYQVDQGAAVLKWSKSGNQGNSWIAGEVDLYLSGHSQILLEAVRGNDYRSDVAVDDISFHVGCCEEGCGISTTSTTTTSTTSTTTTTTSTSTITSSRAPEDTESSCIVQGDPHYKSFDKQAHNFMGTCTYTLSKLCSTNSSLPYFNVEAANEHRSGNAYVSYVRHVTVEVFNHRIVLGKGRVVKVDGEVAVLPMSVTSEVLVALSGQYVVITTSFGLRVKFNGRHRAEVTLPSPFKGKVCGLCGNYNDDRRDDFLNPDGIMEPDSVSFGNSWQTPNDTRCTPDVGVRPNCTSEEKRIIESNQYCGIIVDLHGPFKGCHSKIDPEVYFDDCVYDLCALGTETGSLCSSLESYGDACQSAGAKVEGWRNETFCPLKCGANSHYEQCGSACPATCASPSAPSSCLQPCVEGCVCDSGYLFYNDRCVPKHQCGCWSEGKHYPVGSEFWTDDTCSTQCRCPSAGSQMVCSNSTCSRDSYCGVVNGVPGCYPYTYGICRVHNDPHYNTFDKATLHFMGSCTYTIAKLCGNSSSLPHFNIEAKNENRGNPKVSYVQRVQVAVRDHKVWIVKMEPHRVLVDEVWATLPVQLAEGAVSVRRSGRYVVLSTDFGLHVSYDTDHSVEVKVPSTYFNQTCGMCGNYNGMRGDDYMKPDGEQAKDSNELGNSWKVPPFEPGCDPDEGEEECQPADEARYRSDEFCGLITSQQGPFVNCHSVISAHGIFESCVVELCLLDGDRVALCNSLQIYADACQSAGVTVLPWRNATFCDVMCPANSHYNACASACPTTCTDRSASANCSEPCVEDCECNAGFVLSGSSCVPVENCGCTHNNQYYEKGAMFWEDGCREKCRCTGNDRVECEPGSCGAGEICKVQGGIWGCYRPDTAICHIYGDPHYTTFDGKLYHFQGACNYTVTETCGNSSVRFSLTSRNEHRGNPTWSAINSVGLRLDNLHIALRKNKRVYVDGERVELPVRPIPSVKVTLLGSFVLLETDFGLQVKFDGDQQLVVVVDERYQGQLCGLCGTYTNDQLDDFLKPDGILALDSNQFGNSWAVADDDWQCNQTAPVPPTCDPPSQEEAERYCKIVLDNPGPFEECHWHIPPQLYFESCVYDHCVTGGDSVQLCNTLASYASACEAAGVVLGDWRQQSGCFEKSCALDCNFDSDLCRWTQSKTDTLDWKRISGSTPSFNTGPAFDHTTAGGYYVYLEGNDGKPGDRAQLISAPCVKSGAQCMRFWYHMYGVAQSMGLNVYQVDQGAAVLKWSKSGNQGNSWIAGEVDLYLSGHSQILLEAVRGNDYRSDVAVDDISFHVGCCEGRGTCSASGDPHYNTFDSRVHHFMGTCTYLLSKLCSEASGLPYFDVSATNEHRGTNTKVSWVNSVHVSVHNNTISIMKSHKVMLNGERVNLPVSVMDLVMVRRSGVYVSLETNFGLWVRFDGIHHVDVSVPSEYSGLLCGICGNYNGDRKDDIIMPNGSFAADSNMLGESWQVHNGETECNHVGSDFKCDPKVMENAEKNTACGMITDLTGLFKECHAKVLPKNYFDNCVYDMCMDGGQSPTLCFALQTYSDLCTQAGVCTEWRNNTFCSLTCPIGSHYETCGTGCPATCMHPSAPDTCLVPTVEGCFCDPGYILSVDKCIPSSQCGCTYNNRYYQMYESWFTNGNCTERCTCLGKNVSVCSAWKCGLHEKCERWNGELGCQMAGSASCHIAGGTHYYTFDKIMYSFSGTCAYTLVKMCDSSSVIPVNVSVLNEGQGQLPSSYLREIFIDVFGIRLTLQKNRRMLLDGVRTRSPIKGLLKGINVITNGLNTIIETDFGMSVKFDDNQNLEISLPKSYYSKVCGLCGDYNGQQANEFQMPNGNIASSANHFGNSWKTEEFGSQGCLSRDQVDFPCTLRERLIIESQCKDLLSNKYRSCHALVNPDFFIKNCVQDMCKYHGLLPALCDNIQHYADVCKKEGAELKWRNSTFCPLHCPPKSSYVTCAPACPPTCDNIYGGSSCNKTSVCMEGCACNHGFVQSDVSCVPISECGCRDTNNHYHPVGEIWLTQHCTQVCICKEGGEINCSAHGCELNEVCSLKRNGQYICRPTGFNKCTGGGNPYYLAFDGLIHRFMGENLTTLAETSGIPDRLQEFRILGKNAPLKEKKKAAHLQEVIIEVYGHTVQFKEKQRLVVDDELVNPPIQPHDGLLIYQRSNRFHLETDFGLAVSFQEKANADITVPISYMKWVRGQCSNFSGKSKNDLMQSDGTRNVEVYTSGKSSKDDKNRPPAGVPETTNRQRKHPITDENPESIESDPGFDSQCSKTELTVLNTARYCGIISDPDGPFGSCHQFISPEQYQINCISSICTLMNVTEWLCLTLEQYALHCQEQGVTLGEWRDDTHCEMACPENSQYSIQMSACPASCGNLGAPSECEAPAMEGCECMPGFVLSGFQCVPYKKCGCTYRNKYYEVGERFITEDCDETCECVGTATVHCTKMPCAPNTTCTTANHIRGCY
ncbi:IgGFc-binding protein-like isoform X1 [Narcine bancroftii]|uniref:IgGFc-binding protein-like isoform X1 n=1 Tax=Narcine bancroftii TaxID=1343680 RepID=UPI00383197B9